MGLMYKLKKLLNPPPAGPDTLFYTALLSQTGTAAPVSTELVNTIGAIVWTRFGAGKYRATLTGAYVSGKTVVSINAITPTVGFATIARVDANIIEVSTYTQTGGTFTLADAILSGTSVDIAVYP